MRNPPSMILGCGSLLALQGIAIFAAGAFAGILGMSRLMIVLLTLGGTSAVAGLVGVFLSPRSELPRGKWSGE